MQKTEIEQLIWYMVKNKRQTPPGNQRWRENHPHTPAALPALSGMAETQLGTQTGGNLHSGLPVWGRGLFAYERYTYHPTEGFGTVGEQWEGGQGTG